MNQTNPKNSSAPAAKRGHGDHFTQAELAIIRQAFLAGRKAAEVARELGCARVSIVPHYRRLRADRAIAPRSPKRLPARHYHSDFIPT